MDTVLKIYKQFSGMKQTGGKRVENGDRFRCFWIKKYFAKISDKYFEKVNSSTNNYLEPTDK